MKRGDRRLCFRIVIGDWWLLNICHIFRVSCWSMWLSRGIATVLNLHFPGFMFQCCNWHCDCSTSENLSFFPGFSSQRLGEFRRSVLLSGFHVDRWSRLAVFLLATFDCRGGLLNWNRLLLRICHTFRVFMVIIMVIGDWWLHDFPGFVNWLQLVTGLFTSENLSHFPGFSSQDLVNSENLSYCPGFMLIGDRDWLCFFLPLSTVEDFWKSAILSGFCDEWLSRLCFALKLSTVDILESVILSGFHKTWWSRLFFSLWLVTGDFWISAIFSGFHVNQWLQLFFAWLLATVHVWKSVSLSGFFFIRLGEFQKSVSLSGFHVDRWSRLAVFFLATFDCRGLMKICHTFRVPWWMLITTVFSFCIETVDCWHLRICHTIRVS